MNYSFTGVCDCCGQEGHLHRLVSYGIETVACDQCVGDDPDADIDDQLDFESLLSTRVLLGQSGRKCEVVGCPNWATHVIHPLAGFTFICDEHERR